MTDVLSTSGINGVYLMKDRGKSSYLLSNTLIVNRVENTLKDKLSLMSVYLEQTNVTECNKIKFQEFIEDFLNNPRLARVTWNEINRGDRRHLLHHIFPVKACVLQ